MVKVWCHKLSRGASSGAVLEFGSARLFPGLALTQNGLPSPKSQELRHTKTGDGLTLKTIGRHENVLSWPSVGSVGNGLSM